MFWTFRSSVLLLAALALSWMSDSVLADPAPPTTVNPAVYQYICPEGFDLVNGQCRGFVQQLESEDIKVIEKSIDICGAINGYPPIIRNDEENQYWSNYPKKGSSSIDDIVIGIICNMSTNTWMWADGSKIDYRPSSYNSDLDKSCSSNGEWFYNEGYGFWIHYTGPRTDTFDIHCVSEPKMPEIREDDCINFEESGSMCYQVSNDADTWPDAQNYCKSVGANLASIHSDHENSFIRRLAVSRGYVDGLLLGATISGKSNNFEWIDGSQWNYTNFIPGFPNNGFGDCMVMDTSDKSGRWANNECSTKLPFACSRKPITYTPSNTCPGANVAEGDIITTPGFPANSSTYCDFFLKTEVGKRVEIEVLILEANSCCDYMLLEEGSFGGNVIANLTGSIRGSTFRTVSSNIMRVSWQPGHENDMGAMFSYRGV